MRNLLLIKALVLGVAIHCEPIQVDAYSIDPEPIVLFSFARSGNTWLRYCLEHLTGKPSMSIPVLLKLSPPKNQSKPLFSSEKTVKFLKAHSYGPIQKLFQTDIKQKNSTLVLIIRNPIEAILRESMTSAWSFDNAAKAYMRIIRAFDQSPIPRKVFIYYEDLLRSPKQTLKALLSKLKLPTDRLDRFMKEYDQHKRASIDYYNRMVDTSMTRGDLSQTHQTSSLLKDREKKEIPKKKAMLKQSYPHLYQKYLSRYF